MVYVSKFTSAPEWQNISPIPLNDGSTYFSNLDPKSSTDASVSDEKVVTLVSISYPEEYIEATGYLRAVMARNEMSERALKLTEDVIALNPAHYTVWIYRARIIDALNKDLYEELAWLNKSALKHLKNYQIWHHRQTIVSNTTQFPTLPTGEQSFLMKMFAQDAKNYHVWSYRHWLVRHFKLWDDPQELRDVEFLLNEDVRNNSAWSHRWTLKFGPRGDVDSGFSRVDFGHGKEVKRDLEVVDEDVADAEIEYAKEKILVAPQNRSPWVYLRAVMNAAGRPMRELKGFASKFVDEVFVEKDGVEEKEYLIKSTLAVEMLVDCLLEEARLEEGEEEDAQTKPLRGKKREAVELLTVLKEKHDPIRRNYYAYKIGKIQQSS
ncbi:CAAX geranylgeranyltransferase alpha subunit [Ascosphaera pollenicola]|nr:CAAX geranylgeranyltransferase alpha subunit [Ascosphaera pollenicola]